MAGQNRVHMQAIAQSTEGTHNPVRDNSLCLPEHEIQAANRKAAEMAAFPGYFCCQAIRAPLAAVRQR